jgi:dolichyl-phosphate-mannose--protein O-mannosyl transferase
VVNIKNTFFMGGNQKNQSQANPEERLQEAGFQHDTENNRWTKDQAVISQVEESENEYQIGMLEEGQPKFEEKTVSLDAAIERFSDAGTR